MKYSGKRYELRSLKIQQLHEELRDALRMSAAETGQGRAYYEGRAQALRFALQLLEESTTCN